MLHVTPEDQEKLAQSKRERFALPLYIAVVMLAYLERREGSFMEARQLLEREVHAAMAQSPLPQYVVIDYSTLVTVRGITLNQAIKYLEVEYLHDMQNDPENISPV